jgi:hypothetical protein
MSWKAVAAWLLLSLATASWLSLSSLSLAANILPEPYGYTEMPRGGQRM